MPQDKQSPKGDIVSSIFDRSGKKQASSLFYGKGERPTTASPGKTTRAMKFDAKRKLPFGLDIGASAVKIVQLAKCNR